MKGLKFKLLFLSIAAAFCGHSAIASSGQISDNVIKIGVIEDMSSTYALVAGTDSVIAARMAVEDFGKKEINGARIEIVSADDQNSTVVAKARARQWLEKEKVDFILGTVATTAALGVLPVANEFKKPFAITTSASTALTNANCSPFSMQWMQDTYGLALGTVKGLISQGKKSWYFVTADYAFGWNLEKDASEMIKKRGGEVKGSIRAPFPGADFSAELQAAADSGAQVIAFANAGLDAVGATKQAAAMKLNTKQVIAPLLLFHQDIQTLGPASLADQLVTLGFVWNQSKEAESFSKRFYEKTHRMPDIGHAGNYSATLQYLKAVEAVGTDDGERVMEYLKNPNTVINDAIIKNGHIRADGKVMKPMYVMRIKRQEEMKHDWDFYDIKDVIPAEEASIRAEDSTCYLLNKAIPKPGAAAPAPAPATKPVATSAPAAAPAPAPAAKPVAPTATTSSVKK